MPSGGVERVLILYRGAELAPDEVGALLDRVGVRSAARPPVSTHESAELSRGHAEALVFRQETEGGVDHGAVGRMRLVPAGDRLLVLIDAPTASDRAEVNGWAREPVLRELDRITTRSADLAQRDTWHALGRRDVLDFLTRAAAGPGADGRVRFEAERFGRLCLAVSVVERAAPLLVRRVLPGGYTGLLGEVARGFALAPGEADLAHWTLCRGRRGGVAHLAYLPADREVAPVVPWELLSRAEREHGWTSLLAEHRGDLRG